MPLSQWVDKWWQQSARAVGHFVRMIQQQPARRLLPTISTILVVLLFEVLVATPKNWQQLLLLETSLVLFTSIALSRIRYLVRGWWHTLFAPTLLVLSAGLLLLFVATAPGRQAIIFLTAALLFLFWENIWRYYWDRERYHDEALENTSLAVNTVLVWFSSLFFYHLLLDPTVLPPNVAANILPLSAFLVVTMVFLIDYRTIWVQRYSSSRVWLLLVAQALVVGELFWVVNFLPNVVEVKAFLVVLAYYLFTNLGRSYLDGTLQPIVLRRYLYVAMLSLLAVLVTAQWVV